MKKNVELHLSSDPETLAAEAAAWTLELSQKTLRAQPHFFWALAGGTTPTRYHRAAATLPFEWSKFWIGFSDERAVPAADEKSNYRTAHEALLGRIAIPPERVFRIEADHGDAERAAAAYEERVARYQPFDLVVLGVGPDGHTASLFPGVGEPIDEPRAVISAAAPPSSPVKARVSMSYGAIARAKQLLVLISGAEKAQVVESALEGRGELPIQRVLAARTHTVFWIDQAAGSSLSA